MSILSKLSFITLCISDHTNSDDSYLRDWHISSGSLEIEFPEKSNVLFLSCCLERVVTEVVEILKTNVLLLLVKRLDHDDGIVVSSLFLKSLKSHS